MKTIDEALALIRYIKDYPSVGILFQDITPLLGDADAFAAVVKAMSASERFMQSSISSVSERGLEPLIPCEN